LKFKKHTGINYSSSSWGGYGSQGETDYAKFSCVKEEEEEKKNGKF
jgi:hypothetical protein